MKKHIGFVVKGGIFLSILLSVLFCATKILLVKDLDMDWHNTSTCQGFYEMERDSIDVLFLGSSHCMSSFSLQEFMTTTD